MLTADERRAFLTRSIFFDQFIFLVFCFLLVLAILGLYFWDRNQKKHAILRNYPLVGHFRYLFEYMGEFFRQYWFATDRAKRSWVYRAAKNMMHEVAVLTHSCGAEDPRQLQRKHARIVGADGFSMSLAEIFPDKQPLPEYVEKS